MKLLRSHIRVLERIFCEEILGNPPAQFRSKHLATLKDAGYVQPMEAVLPGRFPVKISGWALTHRGRMAYGEWCQKQPD